MDAAPANKPDEAHDGSSTKPSQTVSDKRDSRQTNKEGDDVQVHDTAEPLAPDQAIGGSHTAAGTSAPNEEDGSTGYKDDQPPVNPHTAETHAIEAGPSERKKSKMPVRPNVANDIGPNEDDHGNPSTAETSIPNEQTVPSKRRESKFVEDVNPSEADNASHPAAEKNKNKYACSFNRRMSNGSLSSEGQANPRGLGSLVNSVDGLACLQHQRGESSNSQGGGASSSNSPATEESSTNQASASSSQAGQTPSQPSTSQVASPLLIQGGQASQESSVNQASASSSQAGEAFSPLSTSQVASHPSTQGGQASQHSPVNQENLPPLNQAEAGDENVQPVDPRELPIISLIPLSRY
jgi:hypothetical protein